ncbi:TfoX/Sxy family DNA transformation protein [Vibrio viridaestus]|uniref:TfoX/Sxy family DNA transformation protein n=1 Tax=Vibrio viridaestus TaxID=2487322 RepID=A0A3N9TGF4_9VIBR|nr:TfoX/Sxy family DNA transformation protein [Vibrio viridaestus]RQW63351.1 TfoX/Sxy family DNA transformation protein [Vibrio viridaestus]
MKIQSNVNGEYLHSFVLTDEMTTKSVFGSTGVFWRGAMFAIIGEDKLFLKGGGWLDEWFSEFNCKRFVLKKKNSTSTVNYFDITQLAINHHSYVEAMVYSSRHLATRHYDYSHSAESRRLRELANMNISLERMLKKSGIYSVKELYSLGAERAFTKVKAKYYGQATDVKCLLKIYGAIHGCHWQLIQQPKIEQLLKNVDELERAEH